MAEYDVAIVGAGILGLSAAYHIKNTHPDAEMLIIDKLSSAGQGNTARSARAEALYDDEEYTHFYGDKVQSQ
jgi:L-2-hydroxyglutarate oxidase LhgO